ADAIERDSQVACRVENVRRDDQVVRPRSESLLGGLAIDVEDLEAHERALPERVTCPVDERASDVGERVLNAVVRQRFEDVRRGATRTRADLEYPQRPAGRPLRDMPAHQLADCAVE